MKPEDRYDWTVRDVAEYLGRPVSWVYDMTRKLGIPAVKVGQALRYSPAEVKEWVQAQRVNAA